MPKIKVKCQTVQTGERPQTYGRTHTRTLPNVRIISPATRSIISKLTATTCKNFQRLHRILCKNGLGICTLSYAWRNVWRNRPYIMQPDWLQPATIMLMTLQVRARFASFCNISILFYRSICIILFYMRGRLYKLYRKSHSCISCISHSSLVRALNVNSVKFKFSYWRIWVTLTKCTKCNEMAIDRNANKCRISR